MPSAEEIKNAEDNLKDNDFRVNYILTYEAPAIAKDFLKLHTNQAAKLSPLNTYLQELTKNVEYYHWYFGSLHTDMQITSRLTAVFNQLYELK